MKLKTINNTRMLHKICPKYFGIRKFYNIFIHHVFLFDGLIIYINGFFIYFVEYSSTRLINPFMMEDTN